MSIDTRQRVLLLALLTSGCAGLTQTQDTVSKFSQGVHAASSREKEFLRDVQLADCNIQFYTQAIRFDQNRRETFDISGSCTPRVLTDEQVRTRAALLDALTLYSDKLAAIASSDDNKKLDANSQKLAGSLNALAKAGGLSNLSVAAGVETAIIAIAEMALDQRRFNDLREAARAMSGYVQTIVTALRTENTAFAMGVASNLVTTESSIRLAVANASRRSNRSGFFDVVQGREILRNANPFGVAPVASSPGSAVPGVNPQSGADGINSILESVLAANDALANASTGGAIAAVTDLAARAQAARAVATSLGK